MAKKKHTPSGGAGEEGHTILPFPSMDEDDSFEESPEYQAQTLVFEAWETSSRRKKVSLAKKALDIFPYCADAFGLLAQYEAKYVEDALEYYIRGYLVGKMALGDDVFQHAVGHFWGLLETRPFMRAYAGMAECFRKLEMHEQAIASYQDMLRLCTSDNMGLRYILMLYLLELTRYKEAESLYRKYRGDYSAWWSYSRALLDFIKKPGTDLPRASLESALEYNSHVPALLLDREPMPEYLPLHYGIGDEGEAVLYADNGRAGWQNAPGALEWLAQQVDS